jgi:peptide deformylase
MLDTMYLSGGVGLAAPQVGHPIQLLVLDLQDGEGHHTMVNPAVTSRQGELVVEEGCLSVPGKNGLVARSRSIQVSYQDLAGEPHTILAQDMLAVVVQHEMDHLVGVLYTDKLVDQSD